MTSNGGENWEMWISLLVGFTVLSFILLVLICKWCRRKKWSSSETTPPAVLLVKRCEQDSVRDVENRIIQRSKFSERTWRPGIDSSLTPVVVFCAVASRIGADIDAAMREVTDWRQVILVVLHNIHCTKLTGDLSDSNYLLDDVVKSKLADRIVHFAFSEYERLYNCRQNDEGFSKIRYLIENIPYSA